MAPSARFGLNVDPNTGGLAIAGRRERLNCALSAAGVRGEVPAEQDTRPPSAFGRGRS